MAGTLLVNIVRFTGLSVNIPTSLPHLLNVNDSPVVPQLVVPRKGGFDIDVTETAVIVTRSPLAGSVDSVDVFVEHRHSMFDVAPPGPLEPFVVSQLSATAPQWSLDAVLTSDGPASFGAITRADPTAGGFNITLPSAADNPGKVVIVKNVSVSLNVITILPSGADTIDGAASDTIAAAHGSDTYYSDGVSDWLIIPTATAAPPSPPPTLLTFATITGEAISQGAPVALANVLGVPRSFRADADGAAPLGTAIGLAASSAGLSAALGAVLSGLLAVPDSVWVVVPAVTDVGAPFYLAESAGQLTLDPSEFALTSSVQILGTIAQGGPGSVVVVVCVGTNLNIASLQAMLRRL